MDDFSKVALGAALGAGGGFIAGIFLEPIKLYFQKHSKLRQMEAAVYREMASNYLGLVNYLTGQRKLQPGHHTYVHDIPRTAETLKQVKGDLLFAQLDNASQIEQFYRRFGSFRGKGEDPAYWQFASDTLKSVNDVLHTKQLNVKLLFSFLSPELKKRFSRSKCRDMITE